MIQKSIESKVFRFKHEIPNRRTAPQLPFSDPEKRKNPWIFLNPRIIFELFILLILGKTLDFTDAR
jgi:hypothetical protein